MHTFVEYAAKVIVGKSDGAVAAPGEYWTAVNVHNPAPYDVPLRIKVATALPDFTPGPVSPFKYVHLGPDEALEVDREDIVRLGHGGDFLKGFVVIQSPRRLDVVAVYTAADANGIITTLHTERVPRRRIRRQLPDLIVWPTERKELCRRNEQNQLEVTVMNVGTGHAGQSATEVDYGEHGRFRQDTPDLAPGASANLTFPIPLSCFDSDCEFKITVDVTNVVAESDESNNIAHGICLG